MRLKLLNDLNKRSSHTLLKSTWILMIILLTNGHQITLDSLRHGWEHRIAFLYASILNKFSCMAAAHSQEFHLIWFLEFILVSQHNKECLDDA